MRRRATAVVTAERAEAPTTAPVAPENGQLLKFNFTNPRPGVTKGPVTPREATSIKEALVRWLDEQM
jgi:hypothetical protein